MVKLCNINEIIKICDNVEYVKFKISERGYSLMKKVTLLSSAVLAGTIALSGVTGVANASESHSHSTTHKSHSTQTHQGNRPYGGVAPKGMTNAQYAELEKSRKCITNV